MNRQLRTISSVLGAVGLLAGLSLISVAGCGSVVGTPGGSGGGGGGASTWAACTAPGQCQLAAKGCCGTCGTPAITDVNGVNINEGAAYQADNCPGPIPPCPACVSQINPELAAFCVAKTCTPIDVRSDDVSACSTDADCRLRYSGCCESCADAAPSLVIALSQSGAATYQSQVCAPDQACDKCAPLYPASMTAVCAASKHCVVAAVDACPAAQPEAKSACSTEGLACEYGDDIRPSCRPRAECTGGVWNVLQAKCPALSGPGENGCPTTTTATGECSPDGLTCDLGKGESCVCGSCVGGPCSLMPHWGCSSPPAAGCPAAAPLLGSPCTIDGQSCVYGTCGAATSAGRVCAGGLWKDQPIACPQ
jgi:hypothetical protein